MKRRRIIQDTGYRIQDAGNPPSAVRNPQSKRQRFVKIALLFILPVLLCSCFPSKKPYEMTQYILQYPPPTVQGLSALPDLIRIERFSVAQSFAGTAMVYKTSPSKVGIYNNTRWRVNPADMVTDYLLRDVRNSGLFRAVFSYRDTEDTRFMVEGTVEEFLEADEGSTGKAVLGINITFLDQKQKELPSRILFQRRYHFTEPLREQTSEALATSMSTAMASFSGQLIRDMVDAINKLEK